MQPTFWGTVMRINKAILKITGFFIALKLTHLNKILKWVCSQPLQTYLMEFRPTSS